MDHDLSASVLHQLRLVGVADTSTLAQRCGVPAAAVRSELHRAAAENWVHRTASTAGSSRWALAPAGRCRGEQLLTAELDARGVRRRVEALHSQFVPLNDELLAVCTDWQLKVSGGVAVPNDHLDVGYDRRIVVRLVALHRRASPMLAELGAVLERFRCYRSRLDVARRHVQAGHHDWLTRPGTDSYHAVWFELHEDLLATLGRSRGDVTPEPPVPAVGTRPENLQEQP